MSDSDDEHELITAAIRGVDAVEECIRRGADVNGQDSVGQTALIFARDAETTACLLEHGADPNIVAKSGIFALRQAAWYGRQDVCELLLKAGADKNKKYQSKTAAQCAADRGHPQLAEFLKSWKPPDLAKERARLDEQKRQIEEQKRRVEMQQQETLRRAREAEAAAARWAEEQRVDKQRIARENEARMETEKKARIEAEHRAEEQRLQQQRKAMEAERASIVAETKAQAERMAAQQRLLDEQKRIVDETTAALKQQLRLAETDLKSESKEKGKSGAWAKQFKGDFECPVPRDELEERDNQVWALTLTSAPSDGTACASSIKHPDLVKKIEQWLDLPQFPKNVKVKMIDVVFNPARFRSFLGELEKLEHRQSLPAFLPHLEQESDNKDRAAVLAHLDSLSKKVTHNLSLRIVRVWHGTSASVLQHILEDGFAAIATLDDGWYGKGIYFSSSAKYAMRYCKTPKVLIMCYALLLNPYPLIAADAPEDKQPEHFAMYGKGNYKNYQCHYARVAPAEPMPTMDFRPPAGSLRVTT